MYIHTYISCLWKYLLHYIAIYVFPIFPCHFFLFFIYFFLKKMSFSIYFYRLPDAGALKIPSDLHQRRRLHHRQGMAFAHDAMHLWPETPTMGWPYDPSILGFTTIEKPRRILKDNCIVSWFSMKPKIDYGMDYIYIIVF